MTFLVSFGEKIRGIWVGVSRISSVGKGTLSDLQIKGFLNLKERRLDRYVSFPKGRMRISNILVHPYPSKFGMYIAAKML